MTTPIYQVDAFASIPFRGNPAAVCLLSEPKPDEWMQSVAGEMNLSETAFLLPEGKDFRLRWFTPKMEVKLCGHATLASAHTLWETDRLQPEETARFHTLSGVLTARKVETWIELNFPVKLAEPVNAPQGLLEALEVEALYVGKNQFDYLVEVEDENTVRQVKPDFTRLESVPARGVIITGKSLTAGYDFVSRFFAPQAGVNEDPVTGSAHTCLAPYWGEKLNKRSLVAYQASARGGELRLRLKEDRVVICGEAITILHGELTA